MRNLCKVLPSEVKPELKNTFWTAFGDEDTQQIHQGIIHLIALTF